MKKKTVNKSSKEEKKLVNYDTMCEQNKNEKEKKKKREFI